MSLGGIAIAIGAMIDAAIIMVENAHKALEHFKEEHGHDPTGMERFNVIVDAAKSVGRPLFYSLLVITVSFIPVFSLEAQEGRLFRPLAFTKTFSMFFAAILGVSLVPVLMVWLIRGKITPEIKNPLNRFLIWLYRPFVNFVLRFRWLTILLSLLVLGLTWIPFSQLGKEFMPPLNEGTLLYMPTAIPGMSMTEATKILQIQDRILKKFPEVESVFGKAGQADTSTDPAPLSMFETVVQLKPPEQWPAGTNWDQLIARMNEASKTPGMPQIFWMPIQTLTEMLTTGFRSALGIKVFCPDLKGIENVAVQIEQLLSDFPNTRSAFAERTTVGYVFVDITSSDIDGYVRGAAREIAQKVHFPQGYYIQWAGQFEYLKAAEGRLVVLVPFTLLIIFFLIYLNTRSVIKTFIVLLSVPFSLVGAFWMLYLLHYNMSVAVWVGLIALAGLDAETGVVMLLYLDHAWEKFKAQGRMNRIEDLYAALI